MKKFTLLSRTVLIIGIALLLSATTYGQHFTAPSSNQGAGQWTFFTAGATLDGVDLVAGDEIAIYDGNTCVGAFVLTQVCDTVNFFSNNWVAYEQAGSGTVGYTAGNSFTFRCWDASAGVEYTGGTYTWYGLIGDGLETDVFPDHNAYPWSYPILTFTSGNAVITNLEGTVTNNPVTDSIANVVVTLTPGNISTTTNSSGYYQFSGLSTGSYDIYFAPPANSYLLNKTITGVSIDATTTTTQNIALDSVNGAISGFVTDVNGAGLDSVRIVAGSYVDTTNYSGYYSLPSVATGTYSVTATYIGTAQNYNSSTQSAVVYSNQTTTLNFTLHIPPGTLSGTVTDANNAGAAVSGVQVIATGYDTTTTDGSGNFSFSLAPGTYNLQFSKTGFHDASASGYVVTSGNTTNADQSIYSYHWTFTSGDPFSDVWTIYLNNLTGDGTDLKAGDEIAIFSAATGNCTSFVEGTVGDGAVTVFASNTSRLSVGDLVDITGTAGDYDGTTPSYYNGTFTVQTVYSDRFLITATWVAGTSTTGTWTMHNKTMTGLTYLDGPVTNQGTNLPLVAFSVLSDGSTGYVAGDLFTFKLFIAGGSENSTLNSIIWSTTSGLYDPSAATPDNQFASGNVFSEVDMDFDVAPGSLTIGFNGGTQLITNLRLYLIKGSDTAASNVYYSYHNTGHTFSGLDAGTYTMSVYGDYYPHTTFNNLSVGIGTSSTVDLTLTGNASITQTINLHSGYQLISRRVGGYTLDMSDFIDNQGIDKSKLDFIRDDVPVTASIDHSSGDIWVDPGDLDWSIFKGYVVKMNADGESISYTNVPINYNVGITINASSYNIISYFPSYDLAATTAFASLMTDDLDFIRDSDGNTLTKVAGSWVDHIGTCTPGEGYLIKWNGSATTFHYPASTKTVSDVSSGELQHFHFSNGNPLKEVYTLYVGGNMLEECDEIAVFDGGKMVGARVINSADDPIQNNVPLFTELFDGSEGYQPGDKIIIKLWKASENKEHWMNFDNVTEASDSFAYTGSTFPTGDNRYSIIELWYSPAGIADNLAEVINLYPNPTNGKITISSPEKVNNIKVYSLLGQQVANFNPGNNQFTIDLSEVEPGIYFVNINANGTLVTKKLTVR